MRARAGMKRDAQNRHVKTCHYFIQDDNCQAFEPGHIFARTLDVTAATSAKNILECDVSEKELLLAAAASRDFLFFFSLVRSSLLVRWMEIH